MSALGVGDQLVVDAGFWRRGRIWRVHDGGMIDVAVRIPATKAIRSYQFHVDAVKPPDFVPPRVRGGSLDEPAPELLEIVRAALRTTLDFGVDHVTRPLAEYDPDEIVTIPTVKKRTHLDRPIERAVSAGQLRLLPGGWRRVRWGDVLEWLRRAREGS